MPATCKPALKPFSAKQKAALQSFLIQSSSCELERNGTGFNISFHESALYPLLAARNSTIIDIRLRCRTYPEGKAYKSPLGNQPFCLPLPERDAEGNFKSSNTSDWPMAEATCRISIADGKYRQTTPIQVPAEFQFE